MRSLKGSLALSIAVLSCSTLAAITLSMSKSSEPHPHRRRQLNSRDTIFTELLNNATGGYYVVQVTAGTPPQRQNLAIDTGSSDVWLLSSETDLCTDRRYQQYYRGGCTSVFDPSESTTYELISEQGFYIQYLDGRQSLGDYITDTLRVGGASIEALQMGLAYQSTLQTGLMGIGYSENEASNSADYWENPYIYPSIIDQMYDQGLINRKAYSLYLDDLSSATGSIIFGGLDSDKYQGELLEIPVIPYQYANGTELYASFAVALTSFAITNETGETTSLTTSAFASPAVLDSGTTLTYLPQRLTALIYQRLGAVNDTEDTGIVYVDCNIRESSPRMTFDYGFGSEDEGVTIKVPIDELIFNLEGLWDLDGYVPPRLPFTDVCALGIFSDDGGPTILGDTFLRSAYVVYDLENNLVALAQTNFNSTTSSVVDFEARATGIPNISGVASSVQVSQTQTGILGGLGGVRTRTGDLSDLPTPTGDPIVPSTQANPTQSTEGSQSSQASQSTSASTDAASTGVGAFDPSGLAVLCITGMFALLVGGLIFV